MGTPAFATGILEAIINDKKHEVVGVVTVADKPAGRGQKLMISDVKKYALSQNLNILQPTNLKDEAFIKELKMLNADVFVVVAFRMLPPVVWRMPKRGTFNLHASLLPQYRGAAPINWAIINGETKTGVTTFFIDDKIDTGEVILSKVLDIFPNEDAGHLHDRLMSLGREAVLETLFQIANNQVKTTKQISSQSLKTAHKLNQENCRINWQDEPQKIINLIKGLNPYPGAWTIFKSENEEWRVKIFDAYFEYDHEINKINQVIISNQTIKICLGGGSLIIKDLQLPNKKRMTSKELLNGWRVENQFFVI